MLSRNIVLVWLAAVAAVGLAAAQQAPSLQQRPSGTPTPDLTVTTQMVVLNVAIHDRSGAPVRGLTARDFEVLDDREPQRVTLVEEHDATQPDQLGPAPPLPVNVYSNVPRAPLNDALNVLLLDGENTSLRDQSRLTTDIRKFAANLPPGARTAIFKLGTHLEIVCGFTAERERLLACLRSNAALPVVPIPTANTNLQANVLSAIADYLSQYPGRKNVLWFASHFPGSGVRPTLAGAPQGDADVLAENALYDVLNGVDTRTRQPLKVNDMVIYTIDPTGLATPAAFKASSSGTAGLANVADTDYALRTTEMEVIARQTGGESFFGTNDIAGNALRAVLDGSNYYTIAYKPSRVRTSKFHHVSIRLAGHDEAIVNYRPGYLAQTDVGASRYKNEHPLPPELSHGAPDSTGILFQVEVQPAFSQLKPTAAPGQAGQFATQIKRPVRYMLDWNSAQGVALGMPAAMPVAVTAVAYNSDGKLLNYVSDTITAGALLPTGAEPYHQPIDLPAGQLFLRLNLTAADGTHGSTEIEIKAAKAR